MEEDSVRTLYLASVILVAGLMCSIGTSNAAQKGPNVELVPRQMSKLKDGVAPMDIDKDLFQPQQVHIAYGNKSDDMVIMWATKSQDISIVEYYAGDRNQLKSMEGEMIHFDEDNVNGAQFLHRVYIADLKPDTKYLYQVKGKLEDSVSEQFSFTVPSLEANTPHTYMVFGDMGTQSNTIQFVVQEAINTKYTAVFHVGDIAYDLNRDGGGIGDQYLKYIQKMAARIPYMTCPGDHERFPEKFSHYRHRFSMPKSPWPMPLDKLWYSFDLGLAHFIVYSTEVFFYDRDNLATEIKWLHEDLRKANAGDQRLRRPWIIVMGHRPMYCSVDDRREDCTSDKSLVRTQLEELFYHSGVDLIISGHEHFYERTYPVYKKAALSYNYKKPRGPVHITIGALGNQYLTEHSSKPGGGWSAFVLSEKDKELYGKLTIQNVSHLSWQCLAAHDNSQVDLLWITTRTHGPFNITASQVWLPDPLEGMGGWMPPTTDDSLTAILTLHYFRGDDDGTRMTVLAIVFIILIVGLLFRKKILNLLRICCLKNEKCQGMSNSVRKV